MRKKNLSEEEPIEFLKLKMPVKTEKSITRPGVISKKQPAFKRIEEDGARKVEIIHIRSKFSAALSNSTVGLFKELPSQFPRVEDGQLYLAYSKYGTLREWGVPLKA